MNTIWNHPSIAFFGRSFAEYARMFSLGPAALAGWAIADIGAGPASFVAEAAALGIRAVGVDPLYGLSRDALAVHVQLDYDRMFERMRRSPELFRYRYFASLEEAEADRRAAAERFLADYESGFVQGRYVGASLPRLPFPDGAFDIALCAHLMFLYGTSFDLAWHVAACRELVRISRREVRIRPLFGLDGAPYPQLAELRDELGAAGVSSEIAEADYAFFAGSERMLVLRTEESPGRNGGAPSRHPSSRGGRP